MAITEAQRACIEDVFGMPSAVVAGAGSGKTETLTNRVVYALRHPEVSGVTGIDQMLVITYTNKAAGELKSRIKSALERAAVSESGLARQALAVDGAWISTIHGMCSRILKENAFAFGVDPAFSVVSDEVRGQLLDEAIEQVLEHPGNTELAGRVAGLFNEYRRADVKDMLAQLVGKASETGAAASEVFAAQPCPAAGDSLMRLVGYTQELLARFEQQERESKKSLSPSAQDYVSQATAAVNETLGLPVDSDAACAAVSGERLEQLQAMEPADALRLAALFPKLNGSLKPAKADLESAGVKPQAALASCALELSLAVGSRHLETLVALVDPVKAAFDERKRARGYLDNDDLLAVCARALSDPRNAAVARRYAEQFKLVMVDEFQDTNQMQVDMINLVAGGSADAPSDKLCVVGDAQQSIYRFRNADLEVFQNHVGNVHATGGKVISLGDNFRSHAEILAFTKGVLTSVFEDSYLDLLHGRDEDAVARDAPFLGGGGADGAEVPRRVNVKVFGAQGNAGISARAAASIAQDFKTLADRGHRPGQMAVLLGKMTHADEYAAALRAVGLKCAITGGTVFRDSVEARLVVDLCYALADMRDTRALADVLTSDLFCLEAGDLLRLVEARDGHAGSLADFVAARVRGDDDVQDVPPALDLALDVLAGAARQVGSQPLSSLLEGVLADSGWLARLGDDGSTRAGNAFKAIRMVRDIEAEGFAGALSLARQLDARIAVLKEAPGVLSAAGDDFVRIMTIHASKGLSIPIVAVAEAEFSTNDRGKLKAVTQGGVTYLGLAADASLDAYDPSGFVRSSAKAYHEKAGSTLPAADAIRALQAGQDAAAFYSSIKRLNDLGDAEEHQRKLYVAYTRAKDALIVAMRKLGAAGSKREQGAVDAPRAMAEWLFGDEAAPEFAEGGEAVRQLVPLHTAYADNPAYDIDWQLRFEVVPPDGEEVEGAGEDSAGGAAGDAGVNAWAPDGAFVLPAGAQDERADEPYRAQWAAGLFSASSLKHENEGGGDWSGETASVDPLPDPAEPGAGLAFEDDDPPAAANERGTAFHALAEWSASHRCAGQALAMPPDDRLTAISRLHGLNEHQRQELPRALERWFSSSQARRVAACAHVIAEQPFWVKLADGAAGAQPLVMQGFIDLLACDELGAGRAYVIDYKTGTALDTDAKRRAAYGIQAKCYAYALLLQGFDEVQLDFVFVDQPDPADPAIPGVTRFPAEDDPPYTVEQLREELLCELSCRVNEATV